jgi:hypothetical protein
MIYKQSKCVVSFFIIATKNVKQFNQGSLTEGEGSVQLTSSLFVKNENIFSI